MTVWFADDYQRWCDRANVIGVMSHTSILCDGDLLCVVTDLGRRDITKHKFVCEAHAADIWPRPYRHVDLPILMFSARHRVLLASVLPTEIEWPEPTERTDSDDLRDQMIVEQRMSNANRQIDQYSWLSPYRTKTHDGEPLSAAAPDDADGDMPRG